MVKRLSDKVTGVTLKSYPAKENDLVVVVHTLEYGKLDIYARGVRKLKSKNMIGCIDMTYSEFMVILKGKNKLASLLTATPIKTYSKIKNDLDLTIYASYFLEAIDKLTTVNEVSNTLNELVINSLELLEEGFDYRIVYIVFNTQLLKYLGYMINTDGCVICSSRSNIVGISVKGGYICSNCYQGEKAYKKEVLLDFARVNRITLKEVKQIKINEVNLNTLIGIVNEFVDYYVPHKFNSRKFMKNYDIKMKEV